MRGSEKEKDLETAKDSVMETGSAMDWEKKKKKEKEKEKAQTTGQPRCRYHRHRMRPD